MLTIDTRESELFDMCRAMISKEGSPWKNLVLKSAMLPLGDILLHEKVTLTDGADITCTDASVGAGDSVLIERKTVADLMASIRDGRYDEQSYRLTHSAEYHPHNIYYLIEGAPTSRSKTTASSFTRGGKWGKCSSKPPAGVCQIAVKKPATSSSNSTSVDNVEVARQRELCTFYSALFSLSHYKGFSVVRTDTLEETAIFCCNTVMKMISKTKDHVFPYFANPSDTTAHAYAIEGKPNADVDVDVDVDADVSTRSSSVPVPNYCSVVKKVKKENVTPANIGEIMLSQIPQISSVSAMAIIQYFGGNLATCIRAVETDPCVLDAICTVDAKGKSRKLPKNVKSALVRYLATSRSTTLDNQENATADADADAEEENENPC